MKEEDLSDHRLSYQKFELLEQNVPENPMDLFQQWYFDAEKCEKVTEANAMTVATVDKDCAPHSRVVLLKKFTWEGFLFYTNYEGDKGRALLENPKVCLSFFWDALERQVIISGAAEKTSDVISDGYFESRPRGSRLGAWASEQSRTVSSRQYLDERLEGFESKFEGQDIPRPPHWGGFLVRPACIEFWQGRPNRMHDRLRYVLNENFDWHIIRLSP